MQNNQIDATLVQFGDWLNLVLQAPGRFHIIKTRNLFNISGASFWANGEWLRKNEEISTAYIAELLKTFRMVHANPKILEPAVARHLPDMPKQIVAPAIKAYIDHRARLAAKWRQHLDSRRYGKVFQRRRRIETGSHTKKSSTQILANALNRVGRVPGVR